MSKPYQTPLIFRSVAGIVAAESTRHGGVSPAPFQSLNLGKHTADQPENVAENRRRFCAALDLVPEQLAWSKQVHGAEVRLVNSAGGATGYDALITNQPDIAVAVSVADCTPILVYDRKNNAVAAIHAGWRGAAAGIVQKTLQEMQESYGTQAADCLAYVGTCIDECSFEVGEAVAAQFADQLKRFDPEKGKYFVDLKKACAEQLQAFGLPEAQIELSPYSTVLNNADYFSHRKENGQTGRMMAVICIKS